MDLADYVLQHTERGECKCGKCMDVGSAPDPAHPHTVNTVFMKIAPRNAPEVEAFRGLTRTHRGAYCDVDPFDGKEHGYIELGGWLGDQGLALQYMALGTALGVFQMLTPYTLLGLAEGDPLAMQMAGEGYVAIRIKPA